MIGWLRLSALAPTHPKIATLPSDAARWTWILVLCDAKLRTPQGQWASLDHLAACIPGRRRHLSDLLTAGLLEVDPDGAVSVHGWEEWQSGCPSDPTTAARSRRYRERHRDTVAQREDRDTVTPSRHATATPSRHGQTETETETENSPPLPPSPKPPPKPKPPPHDPDGFAVFWERYPRKVAKQDARNAWNKHRPPTALVLEALAWQTKNHDWTREAGRFVPYPATYLHARRWEDPVPLLPPNIPRNQAGIAEFMAARKEQQDGPPGGNPRLDLVSSLRLPELHTPGRDG